MNLSQLVHINHSIAMNEMKNCMEMLRNNTSPIETVTFNFIAVLHGIIVVLNAFMIVAIKRTNQKSQSIKLLLYNAIVISFRDLVVALAFYFF